MLLSNFEHYTKESHVLDIWKYQVLESLAWLPTDCLKLLVKAFLLYYLTWMIYCPPESVDRLT